MFLQEESFLFHKEEEKEKKSPLERHTPVQSKKTSKKSKRLVYNVKNHKRRVK